MLEILTACPQLLIAVPLGGALLMLVCKNASLRYGLLLTVGVLHVLCSAALLARFATANGKPVTIQAIGGLMQPDATGTLFLTLASVLFLAAGVYAVGYLKVEAANTAPRRNFQDGTTFTNAPEQRFLCCLCLFLASMSLVTTTAHMGALWVGIECTTLSSAPLIYFHRHSQSLEATWKYLMICSVGIALALLGNILFTIAYYPAESDMNQIAFFTSRAAEALAKDLVPVPWLKAGFIFLLVGYGTKMGLAPLHNWLPDAHSQAPSLVSALLSGALLNCAFLGILRGHQVLLAARMGDFSGGLLVFFGLTSMVVAAVFIVDQGHFKRLLAYSSVEHMGILALGVGLGGGAVFGSMLHAVNHSLTKCMLFLLAGNILTHYHTLSSYDARGLRWIMPATAALWGAGFLAITGTPPFGVFVSEFTILSELVKNGHWLKMVIYLGALGTIFIGMSVPVLRMVQGQKPPAITTKFHETGWNILPSLVLGLIVLTLGLWIPDWLTQFLRAAAANIGGATHGI